MQRRNYNWRFYSFIYIFLFFSTIGREVSCTYRPDQDLYLATLIPRYHSRPHFKQR
ncbi:MAG: hypothetical protein WBG73_23335 [Coleofasciculaceae cyanobacterium]